MNNIKRKIPIIVLFLAVGFFGYKYFSSSNAKKIEIQNEVAENNNSTEINLEEVKNNSEETPPLKADDKEETEAVAEKTAPADKINISNKLVSWGYEKSNGRKIDTVIIHSTYNALGGDQYSLSKILDIYKSYGVSPHYIIDRGGKIYRLVADENTAYHAGVSQVPDGRMGVNNFSIGIELINSKTEKPTSEQYTALKKLITQLKSQYSIKYTLGHNQIAPGRKDDPWNFDWGIIKK
ncbi:MAG: N-acetylmuramoyl-L-alanine amidase [Parcubacteria group bacterium]